MPWVSMPLAGQGLYLHLMHFSRALSRHRQQDPSILDIIGIPLVHYNTHLFFFFSVSIRRLVDTNK